LKKKIKLLIQDRQVLDCRRKNVSELTESFINQIISINNNTMT